MNLNSYLSNKIAILSFLLTVFIVILHANMAMFCTGWISFIQHTITAEVTRIAVPMFYLISGFLFFINYNGTFGDYKRKLKTRTRSLLIPYIFFLLCGSCIMFIIDGVYTLGSFCGIIKHGIMYYPPIFYPLWYLRDLYVMVLFSPLVYLMIKKMPILLFLPFLLWVFDKEPFVFPLNEAMFFFPLGAFFSKYTNRLEKTNHKSVWIYFCLWFLSCFFYDYMKENGLNPPYITHCAIILLGIYSLWILYDKLYPRFSERVKTANIYKYSFFLYLLHEPILTIIKKTGLYLLGQASWSIVVIYLLAPIMTICIVYAIGRGMNRYTPRLLMFITGGRTKRT